MKQHTNIIVGSNCFFKDIKDFNSKDVDKVIIIENPKNFKHQFRIHVAINDIIYVEKENKNNMLNYVLHNCDGLVFGRFLVPEFNKEFNITLEDLKIIEPLLDKLDNKHKYFKVIYNAYLKNKDMILTDEQRNEAYKIYKQYR